MYRIDEATFDLWLAILAAVPGSVLWMVAHKQAITTYAITTYAITIWAITI